MAPKATTFDALHGELEAVLTRHLPHSLPLLRRLQFERHYRPQGVTGSRIVLISDIDEAPPAPAEGVVSEAVAAAVAAAGGQVQVQGVAFTAAHVDLAAGTMVAYSTLEDVDDLVYAKVARSLGAYYEGQVRMLVDEVVRLAAEYAAEPQQELQQEQQGGEQEEELQREDEERREERVKRLFPKGLVLGTLNSRLRNILIYMDEGRRIAPRPTGFYGKWLWSVAGIPAEVGEDLPAGMRWSTATIKDCVLVVSRTDIPRTP